MIQKMINFDDAIIKETKEPNPNWLKLLIIHREY